MTLAEVLEVMADPDRIRIIQGTAELYAGYLANLRYAPECEKFKEAEVIRITNNLDIKHKRYKELGLMQPLHPEQTPDYEFSDLRLTLYKVIILKSEE